MRPNRQSGLRRPVGTVGAAAAAALLLGGCEPAGDSRAATVERDSAGIAIVESSPPYASWAVDPTPAVRIGVVSGEAEYQFTGVAYAGRLSDGGVVVVDGGSSEVRWYGPEGRFRARAGGHGEGPGELRRVASAALSAGDTLVLYDSGNQRLSWFSPAGEMSRSRRAAWGAGSTVGLHPLAGGRLLVAEERLTTRLGGAEYNLARDTLLLMVASGASTAVDTLMRAPGREATTWVNYVDGRPSATMQMELPFGHRPLAAGAADRIVLVAAGRHDLALLAADGGLEGLARRSDVDPPAVSAELRRSYAVHAGERAAAAGGSERTARASAERRLELLPEGRALTAFDRILADARSGDFWLRDHLPPWRADEGRQWTVHDRSGRVLARVATPAGLRLTQVTSSHVVGVERDALDVESVVVHPLR